MKLQNEIDLFWKLDAERINRLAKEADDSGISIPIGDADKKSSLSDERSDIKGEAAKALARLSKASRKAAEYLKKVAAGNFKLINPIRINRGV